MRSNIEWKKWGERDPLYAVSTWAGKERGGPHAWTDDEFYELGRSDWSDFRKHWAGYGLQEDHCVEIGCGAGRITKQLAASFAEVTAADVSEHQLDYAKGRLAALNVHFVLTDGVQLPLSDQACSAAFSTHVFQHFDSQKEALSVFREVYRVLRSGGSMMIHLPAYQLPDMPISSFFRPLISLVKRLGDIRAAANRRMLAKGKWKFVMRRLRYEREALIHSLGSIGFKDIEFRFFAVRSNGAFHEFLFARKDSPS